MRLLPHAAVRYVTYVYSLSRSKYGVCLCLGVKGWVTSCCVDVVMLGRSKGGEKYLICWTIYELDRRCAKDKINAYDFGLCLF